jgi:hypothetical protein
VAWHGGQPTTTSTMTIKETIQKAVEGGYHPYFIGQYRYEFVKDGIYVADGEPSVNLYPYEKVLIDSLFWQSLGKALGWKQSCVNGCIPPDSDYCGQPNHRYEWQEQWHRFIDYLVEGKSAEEFFAGSDPDS